MTKVIFDVPKLIRSLPTRPMNKNELRAAVDYLWVDLSKNYFDMSDVDELEWKARRYQTMKSGTVCCADDWLAYAPNDKANDATDDPSGN